MQTLLGAHIPIKGGLFKGVTEGHAIGCQTIQIFTKSSNQWKAKELTEEEIACFREVCKQTGISLIVAHDSYLINLVSPDEGLRKKSQDAFLIEMERAEALGIQYLVTHCGSHLNSGEEVGLKRLAESINLIHRAIGGFNVQTVLETTAGQGTNLGYRFEQIAEVLSMVDQNEKVGVCFDTCHVFASGYDIADESSYTKTMAEFDRVIGFDKIRVFHLNDSKKGLGSRVDRHEHIGQGSIGTEAFRLVLNDTRFTGIPMILETPDPEDMNEINLKTLRGLIGQKIS